MSDLVKMLDDAVEKWRLNKGIGTFIIPNPIDSRPLILSVLQRRYNKDPTAKILLVVDDWNARNNFITYLTTTECKENNDEFMRLIQDKNLIVASRNGVCNDKFKVLKFDSVVVYNVKYYPHKLSYICSEARYKLVILDKLLEVNAERTDLYRNCPVISNFSQNEFDKLRTSTPVEEELIDVVIPENTEDYKLLQYYNEYITTSLNIFGNFDIMQEARVGNDKFNISATQICYKIADENGWRPDLDMSVPINVQIDEMYNPTSLKERATRTYECIRSRAELLSNYDGKFPIINRLVNEHPDDKILIISKRGNFANKVTQHLNAMAGQIICGDYHDHVDPVPELDSNGRPVCYKSGEKKGKQRFLGATAQKHRNEQMFLSNKLRVLSTNNAPDKTLNADISVVIITSPQCETIESYMYRLANVCYPRNKIKLYTIYVKNSLEEKKLQNRVVAKTHTIVNKCENAVVLENNSDFIVVN